MSKEKNQIDLKRLKRLLRHMIDIYSPSGKEEDLLDYLYAYLQRQGLPALRQRVDDNRYNLIVMPVTAEPQILLMGHLDTVAAYEYTHSGFQIKGDVISGLGAADMKGGCAAMIEAYVAAWQNTSGKLSAALALVVGEEENADGAAKFVEQYNIPWVIIGEPTDLQPCLGSYGYLEVQFLSEGRRMHASMANRGESAVHALLLLLTNIISYLEVKRTDVVVNIRDLESMRVGFAAPERCEAWLDIHVPPGIPLESIVAELDELSCIATSSQNALKTTMRFSSIFSGYSLAETGPLIKTLKKIYKQHSLAWNPAPFPSHSDANFLWKSGFRPIILGPGSLEQAHTPDESISLSQIISATELYFDLCLYS
ncbi:MAG: peptidase M20 [Candidatus Fischerbacteria bacterium RBG_13_37_8]|uniref:Peptidase M20 n=1 Tax=Candidatus Fischerbacteria bacterium RBG_13_37_8 TaxID=1817863 RepID=A0A1F5VU83_9BACT|nr:MAG: peptidase M20 [Candidatus Fischerbacteria bacterium RBG_13_37_8]